MLIVSELIDPRSACHLNYKMQTIQYAVNGRQCYKNRDTQKMPLNVKKIE